MQILQGSPCLQGSGQEHTPVRSARMRVAAIVSHWRSVSFPEAGPPLSQVVMVAHESLYPTDWVGPRPKVILLIWTLLASSSGQDTPTVEALGHGWFWHSPLGDQNHCPHSLPSCSVSFLWEQSGRTTLTPRHNVLGPLSCRHPHSEAGISRPLWHL